MQVEREHREAQEMLAVPALQRKSVVPVVVAAGAMVWRWIGLQVAARRSVGSGVVQPEMGHWCLGATGTDIAVRRQLMAVVLLSGPLVEG